MFPVYLGRTLKSNWEAGFKRPRPSLNKLRVLSLLCAGNECLTQHSPGVNNIEIIATNKTVHT